MSARRKPSDSDEAEGLFKTYEEYARTLRTWLVAYGVGGPVLLLTNDIVRHAIAASGKARQITTAFLIGVGLQVLLAFLNKTILWLTYFAQLHPEIAKRLHYRVASWLCEEFWIDFLIDLVSLGFLAWATYRAFEILV